MNAYLCRGAVPWREYCECPDCDGHVMLWHIDRIVIADSPAHAAQLISDDYNQWPVGMEEGVGEKHILKSLRITEAAEEQRMLAAGQPQLFQEAP